MESFLREKQNMSMIQQFGGPPFEELRSSNCFVHHFISLSCHCGGILAKFFFFLQCGFRSLRSAGSPKISRQCFNEVEVWTLKLCRFTSATGTAIPHLLILSFHSSIQSQRMLKSVQMSPIFCRANLYRPPYFNGLRIS